MFRSVFKKNILLQVKPDVKVTVNVPSLSIEEMTPSFQSDVTNLLPLVKNKSQYVGQTEKRKSDKLQERRKKRKRTKSADGS